MKYSIKNKRTDELLDETYEIEEIVELYENEELSMDSVFCVTNTNEKWLNYNQLIDLKLNKSNKKEKESDLPTGCCFSKYGMIVVFLGTVIPIFDFSRWSNFFNFEFPLFTGAEAFASIYPLFATFIYLPFLITDIFYLKTKKRQAGYWDSLSHIIVFFLLIFNLGLIY